MDRFIMPLKRQSRTWVRPMHQAGERGSIVTVLCDSGERDCQSYYNDDWLASRGIEVGPAVTAIRARAEEGRPLPWSLTAGGGVCSS